MLWGGGCSRHYITVRLQRIRLAQSQVHCADTLFLISDSVHYFVNRADFPKHFRPEHCSALCSLLALAMSGHQLKLRCIAKALFLSEEFAVVCAAKLGWMNTTERQHF